MVDGLQNQKVGNMLSVLYATERFWYCLLYTSDDADE